MSRFDEGGRAESVPIESSCSRADAKPVSTGRRTHGESSRSRRAQESILGTLAPMAKVASHPAAGRPALRPRPTAAPR
jgi:hypothetical protein